MKKIKLFLALALGLFFSINAANAQKQNVIKINPLSLALANISASYERILSEKTSVQLQGSYWIGSSIKSGEDEVKLSGYAFTPEFRFYVSDNERPKGFYLAPFFRYEALKANDKTVTDSKATVTRIGGGAAFGYQFLFGERVTWDLFLGPRYYSNSVKYSDENNNNDRVDLDRFTGNFGLRLGTTVGIAF